MMPTPSSFVSPSRRLRNYLRSLRLMVGDTRNQVYETRAAFSDQLRRLEDLARDHATELSKSVSSRETEHSQLVEILSFLHDDGRWRRQRLRELRADVWHQFVVRVDAPDEVREELTRRGVETLIHYPIPPHRSAAYAADYPDPLPVTERLAATVLSLPISPQLNETECALVCAALIESVAQISGAVDGPADVDWRSQRVREARPPMPKPSASTPNRGGWNPEGWRL